MGRVAFFIMLSSFVSHLLLLNARADEAVTMYRRATGCQAPGVKSGRECYLLTAEVLPIANSKPCLVCEGLPSTQLHANLSLAELASEVGSNTCILKRAHFAIIVAAVQNAGSGTSLRQQFHYLDHHAIDQHCPCDCRARPGLGAAAFDRDQSVTRFAIPQRPYHLPSHLHDFWQLLRLAAHPGIGNPGPSLCVLHPPLCRSSPPA